MGTAQEHKAEQVGASTDSSGQQARSSQNGGALGDSNQLALSRLSDADRTGAGSDGGSTWGALSLDGDGMDDGSAPAEGDDGITWGEGAETPGVRAGTRQYTVQSGDTLSGLAARAGHTSWDALYNLNRHLNPDEDTLRVGQVLVLPWGWDIPGSVEDPDNLLGDPMVTSVRASTGHDGTMSYDSPSLSQGVQVAADGSESAVATHVAGEQQEVERSVVVHHGFENPITLPATPAGEVGRASR